MCGNGIGIPLLLVHGKVFARVFFNLLTVRITNIIAETQSVFRSGRRIVEKLFCVPCANSRIKISNKTVYVVVSDSYKNVRHRGTTRTVGIAAEIPFPKIFVEMIKALQSGMME